MHFLYASHDLNLYGTTVSKPKLESKNEMLIKRLLGAGKFREAVHVD